MKLTDEQRGTIQQAADTAHRVLCAGGDDGDELSDAGLRRDLKAARDALRALLAAPVAPAAVAPLTKEQSEVIADAERVLCENWEHETADRLHEAFASAAARATVKGDTQGFIPGRLTASQTITSQYAHGWNDCLAEIERNLSQQRCTDATPQVVALSDEQRATRDTRFTHPGCECCACPAGVCQAEAARHDERAALTDQQIYDKFYFLEGLVSEGTYRRIADAAIEICRSAVSQSTVNGSETDMRAVTEDRKAVVKAERAIRNNPSATLSIVRGLQAALDEARAAVSQATKGDDQEAFPYQQTFNAIAAATKIDGGHIGISVIAFREAFGATAPQTGAMLDEPGLTNPLAPYGMLVRALRIVANTTLLDMAKSLSSTPATLSAVEFGHKPLTDAMVAATAAFFSSLGIHDTLHALSAARDGAADVR
ncbi:hypothetical protein [Paraburkholderia sp.]|uniref:hypothetical protein n=1 Tax=Paraburkholderia sp. TaxID=1926495 RepID=UPI0025ECEB76|nr:hypothetical protein [Paraburkholderia sp.]